MPVSALLIRWNGGWHEYVSLVAESEFGRKEAFLSLGATQSVNEARRLAAAELDTQFAKVREQITAEHRPENLSEVPYVAYKPGDSKITAKNFQGGIDEFEVVSMTVAEDDDGVVTFVPTMGDHLMDSAAFEREGWMGPRIRNPDTGKNTGSGGIPPHLD